MAAPPVDDTPVLPRARSTAFVAMASFALRVPETHSASPGSWTRAASHHSKSKPVSSKPARCNPAAMKHTADRQPT